VSIRLKRPFLAGATTKYHATGKRYPAVAEAGYQAVPWVRGVEPLVIQFSVRVLRGA
jgi:hypothetical protein